MRKLAPIACALLLATVQLPAHAAAPDEAVWTTQPVRLVVPTAAGGSLDQLTRVLGDEMTRLSGQTFIVENRGGGAGAVARQYVANGSTDGTLLFMGQVHEVTRAALVANVPSPMTPENFEAVAMIGSVPNVLVVNPELPVTTMAQLRDLAKSRERSLDYGIGSVGNLQHLTGILFQDRTGLDLVSVPYRGSAPAIVDLIGGQIQILFETMPAALPHIQTGKLRALAVTSAQRASVLPDVPTFKEAGLDGIELETWYGVFVKTGTPVAVRDSIGALVSRALQAESVRRAWAQAGLKPGPYPVNAAFAQFVGDERQRWADLIARTGVRVEE